MMYRVLFFVCIGLAYQATFATYSRVTSMGKSATFFMDDVSIFDNPANINVFPNFLIGELGSFTFDETDQAQLNLNKTASGNFYNPRYNRDPIDPWFGGLFAYSLGSKESGKSYPQVSIGGAFNRIDRELMSYLPDSMIWLNNQSQVDSVAIAAPVTNFDGFLGFTLASGAMFGSHIYVAIQDGADQVNGPGAPIINKHINTYVFKGDLGVNWPISRSIDGEFSVGLASIQYGPTEVIDPELSYFFRFRSFISLDLINGELVPTANIKQINTAAITETAANIGLGVNASLDRGFFWLGLEGIFSMKETGNFNDTGSMAIYDHTGNTLIGSSNHTIDVRGLSVSFGIERNIWWDWLVLRVGGKKDIHFVEKDAVNDYLYTNPIADGSPNDHIGFGVGINVEEKLKVDAVVAEDILFTGGNLLSGPHHHVLSRISATYSF